MEIIVKTQKEFDALPDSFSEYTRIYIESSERIVVNKAWDNSSVVAWDNSSVVARDNSSVVARDNSSVVARGNSSVEARGNVGVHLYSDYATVILFVFSVCWKLAKGKIQKKSKNATIITPKKVDWFETNGIKKTKTITLYKKVSKDFKTQENTKNETLWLVGSIVDHSNWTPEKEECGEGKFHACSRPYFCDEFRSEKGDKYIAIEVALKDTYAWPNPSYPYKIAFKKCKVLYEVNKMGKKI